MREDNSKLSQWIYAWTSCSVGQGKEQLLIFLREKNFDKYGFSYWNILWYVGTDNL